METPLCSNDFPLIRIFDSTNPGHVFQEWEGLICNFISPIYIGCLLLLPHIITNKNTKMMSLMKNVLAKKRADWCFKLHYNIWCEVCNEIWQGKLTWEFLIFPIWNAKVKEWFLSIIRSGIFCLSYFFLFILACSSFWCNRFFRSNRC